jgi:hypothetical protein
MTTATTTEITIPAARLGQAEKLIKSFARKAAKLGLAAPTLTVTRTFERIWTCRPTTPEVLAGPAAPKDGEFDRREPLAGPWDGFIPCCLRDEVTLIALPMVDIIVTGQRPIIAGWEFAAVLERIGERNLLRCAPGIGEVPERFRSVGKVCEHCRKPRKRNLTYILRSETTGEWRQVAKTCLRDFLGSTDPAAYMAALTELKRLAELSDWDDGLGGFWGGGIVVTREVFLAAVACLARLDGWVSAAGRGGLMPTGDVAMTFTTSPDPEAREKFLALITDKDREVAAGALAWLAETSETSDYFHNLRTVASLAIVSHHHARLLASLIPAFNRDLGRRAERASKINEHLPGVRVGDKVTIEVTIVGSNTWRTDWGSTTLIRFEDEDGRTLVWRASNPGDHWMTGDRVQLGGTVKALDEYRGTKQTVLTRAKITVPLDGSPVLRGSASVMGAAS